MRWKWIVPGLVKCGDKSSRLNQTCIEAALVSGDATMRPSAEPLWLTNLWVPGFFTASNSCRMTKGTQ